MLESKLIIFLILNINLTVGQDTGVDYCIDQTCITKSFSYWENGYDGNTFFNKNKF